MLVFLSDRRLVTGAKLSVYSYEATAQYCDVIIRYGCSIIFSLRLQWLKLLQEIFSGMTPH